MTTTIKSNTYDTTAGTRVVEQTVIYTKADDLLALAQALNALGNLHKALNDATHPSIMAQLEGQIAAKQAEVDALQANVDGYEASV